MADPNKSERDVEGAANPTGEAGAQQGAQAQQQRIQVQIDDSKALALYANFCRVTGTPEELIIDFGLNPQPFGLPTHPIPVTQRIITNFYTAKRMLHALQLTIQRHEATFGVLETDVQKRVRVGAPGQPQQPPRIQVQIDDSKVMATYANFCRVTGTPEEMIIDFGLNPQPFGVPTTPIPVTQRIITNFYTAKRMLAALQMTIQRHEATFGVLETDVQKRVMPRSMG